VSPIADDKTLNGMLESGEIEPENIAEGQPHVLVPGKRGG